MAKLSKFRIETLSFSSTRIVWRGDVKVAILFSPLNEGESYQLYPHPATYPTLDFRGLPAPLRPEFMSFPDLEAVEAFLGIAARDDGEAEVRRAA
ncbi:MAG: hypothetical protein INR70_25190 [Parafilimonas terrae]|nr:hypothetical protein [Parafilimonas terrae]